MLAGGSHPASAGSSPAGGRPLAWASRRRSARISWPSLRVSLLLSAAPAIAPVNSGASENALRPTDAATAYEAAAAAALYPFLRAQFLSDAGRAWLAAGDSAKALAAYRTIAEKLDSTTAAGEAKVRLGELTKGSGHP